MLILGVLITIPSLKWFVFDASKPSLISGTRKMQNTLHRGVVFIIFIQHVWTSAHYLMFLVEYGKFPIVRTSDDNAGVRNDTFIG